MGPKVEQNSLVESENDDCREGVDPISVDAGKNANSTIPKLTNEICVDKKY